MASDASVAQVRQSRTRPLVPEDRLLTDASEATNHPLWKLDTELTGRLLRMAYPVVLAMLTQIAVVAAVSVYELIIAIVSFTSELIVGSIVASVGEKLGDIDGDSDGLDDGLSESGALMYRLVASVVSRATFH